MNYSNTSKNGSNYNIYFNDGTSLVLYSGFCIVLIFDVNSDNNPNLMGRDRFAFEYCPSDVEMAGQIISYNLQNIKTREDALKKCKEYAHQCSTLLYYDSWEFKDDYPFRIY